MSLPSPSEELCFNPNVFQSEEFSVDEFVSQYKRRVTTEHLHDDLQSYYATLKAAMVELINKDYADFLDLSANLVGMDKQIEGLSSPLSRLHQEIMAIKYSMEKVLHSLENKMAARKALREKKVKLQKLMVVMDTTDLLEKLLDIRGGKAGRVIQGGELDRVAMEFNKLRHNASSIADHSLVKTLTPRMVAITECFQKILEEMLTQALNEKNHELLLHSLETYVLICRQDAAEELFRNYIVLPNMNEIISTKAILTQSEGLIGMYSAILKFIPKYCGFILEVSEGVHGTDEFDFLVNAVWPEVVTAIETRASVIFAPGNPDTFYKNFIATMDFLDKFESSCRSIEQVKRLRAHPNYISFINKWSLPVYFQIRFQEIAGNLESKLDLPLKEADEIGLYSLEIFSVLSSCLIQCWADGTYLSALVHRFWKLTLQLIIRLGVWLSEVLEKPEVLSVNDCVKLVHDIHTLDEQMPNIFNNNILPKTKQFTIQQVSLQQTCGCLVVLLPKISDCATDVLSNQSVKNLEPVYTIPRLYRRTNREIPSKASSYVTIILKPICQMSEELEGEQGLKWKRRVIDIVTERYHDMTSEVLSNVKRTEDSLLKLKRSRRSLIPETTSGMSDDNKIRLQIALDIEYYIQEVNKILTSEYTSSSLTKLLEMAALAKSTAFTTPTDTN